MHAYELLPLLKFLTLTVDNDEEYWEDRIQFIGTENQWLLAEEQQAFLSHGHE